MLLSYLKKIPVYLIVVFIKIYQRTLSPDHGLLKIYYPHGCCRFYPSCSNYSLAAYQKYGFLKGSLKTLQRLGRCHPFSPSSFDELI